MDTALSGRSIVWFGFGGDFAQSVGTWVWCVRANSSNKSHLRSDLIIRGTRGQTDPGQQQGTALLGPLASVGSWEQHGGFWEIVKQHWEFLQITKYLKAIFFKRYTVQMNVLVYCILVYIFLTANIQQWIYSGRGAELASETLLLFRLWLCFGWDNLYNSEWQASLQILLHEEPCCGKVLTDVLGVVKEGNISLWSFKLLLFLSLGVSEEYKLNVFRLESSPSGKKKTNQNSQL